MLIKIKTQEEFRSDHVTIEIVADRHELDSAMSGPGEEWLAARRENDRIRDLEGELASTTRVQDALERELERRTKERDEREAARANLEKSMGEEVRKLRAQVAEYDRDRKTERDRADRNMTRAQKAEGSLKESRDLVAFKDKLRADIDQDNVKLRGKVRELAAQIGKVNGAVHSPDILAALKTTWLEDTPTWAMANAVRNVRQILGSPESETSQA